MTSLFAFCQQWLTFAPSLPLNRKYAAWILIWAAHSFLLLNREKLWTSFQFNSPFCEIFMNNCSLDFSQHNASWHATISVTWSGLFIFIMRRAGNWIFTAKKATIENVRPLKTLAQWNLCTVNQRLTVNIIFISLNNDAEATDAFR